MPSNKRKQRNKAIIASLVEQYPAVFSLQARYIKPLCSDIIQQVIKDQRIHKDNIGYIVSAITWYQHWDGYFTAVAFATDKVNLHGEPSEPVTAAERVLARDVLKERGKWTYQQDSGFAGRQLQLDKTED